MPRKKTNPATSAPSPTVPLELMQYCCALRGKPHDGDGIVSLGHLAFSVGASPTAPLHTILAEGYRAAAMTLADHHRLSMPKPRRGRPFGARRNDPVDLWLAKGIAQSALESGALFHRLNTRKARAIVKAMEVTKCAETGEVLVRRQERGVSFDRLKPLIEVEILELSPLVIHMRQHIWKHCLSVRQRMAIALSSPDARSIQQE